MKLFQTFASLSNVVMWHTSKTFQTIRLDSTVCRGEDMREKYVKNPRKDLL